MSKGPYKYSEISGSKSLATSRPNMSGKGRMSGAHGVVPRGPTKGMTNAEGRLGATTRAFKSVLSETTGGCKDGTRHASQPKGSGK